MAETVLILFEGAYTEPQILKSLRTCFFGDHPTTIVTATYGTDIYQLWREIRRDPDLHVVELIRAKSEANKRALHGLTRDNISQIFLFFDYDGHAYNASAETVDKMLAHFDNETEYGKLYVSYPMVEAIKHIKRGVNFRDTAFEVLRGNNYKALVHLQSESDYQHIKKLTASSWNHIIVQNYRKANYIIKGVYRKPRFSRTFYQRMSQKRIFQGQVKHYIHPKGEVAVLSAFPFFIIEYFGMDCYRGL